MAIPATFNLLTLSAIFSLLASLGVGTNVLYSGGRLSTGESLVYKQYTLIMQTDCDLAVYDGDNRIWASGSAGKGDGCYLTLESNGELIVYSPISGSSNAVWRSNATSDQGRSFALVLQYDGTLRVYGPILWSNPSATVTPAKTLRSTGMSWPSTTDSVLFTGDVAPIGTTIVNTGYALVLEDSCDLVLYNTEVGKVLWQTNTTDPLKACYVNLEATGEFILKYMGGDILWRNGVKSDYGEYVLVLRPDGKLVVYGPAIWSNEKSGAVAVLAASLPRIPSEKITMVTVE